MTVMRMNEIAIESLANQKKLDDAYLRLRGKVAQLLDGDWTDRRFAGKPLSEWMTYVAALPDMFHLSVKLVMDDDVPLARKAALVAAITYVITPLDLIPDVIPVIGQLDDLVILAKALQFLMDKDDPKINAAMQRHWAGSDDSLQVLHNVIAVSDTLLLSLPKGVAALVHKLFAKSAADELPTKETTE
jgi:uncharacterized membrane protein YkvA (DUF1232 family)